MIDKSIPASLDTPDPAVIPHLKASAKGEVKNTLANMRAILVRDQKYRGRIAFDVFRREVVLDDEPISDQATTEMRMDIGTRYGIEPAKSRMWEVIQVVAHGNRVSAVATWLDSLQWDGTPRLSTWLTSALGAEDNELHRAFAHRFAISAVARAFKPGCKVDTVLVLVGGQGLGKSTAFRVLASDDWFADTPLKVGGKDAYMQLGQAWIYEVAEMTSFTGVRADAVKGFVTSNTDTFRPPYGRSILKLPRQTVFVGTTNEERPLEDPTGSRRFWPVRPARRLDLKWLTSNREQVWAEAVSAFRAGEEWHLTAHEEQLRERHNQDFEARDPWTGQVADWVQGRPGSPFTLRDCIAGALGVVHADRSHENRVGAILRSLGYEKRKAGRGEVDDGSRPWLWSAATDELIM